MEGRARRRLDGRAIAPVAMASTVLLALVLGLWQLGQPSLDNDEGVSARVAHEHMSVLLTYVRDIEPNNILYFGFLHFWEKLGSSDAFLRLPSVVAFPAAVAFTGAIAWRSFGRVAGVVAGLLLALNSLALAVAQQARAYAWLTALVAASVLCFMLVVERPTARRWTLLVAVSALAAYAHPYALFVVAAQAISLAWLPPGRIAWRPAAIATAALALAVLPLLFLLATGNTDRVSWIQPLGASQAWDELQTMAGAQDQPLLLLLYLGLALVLLAGVLAARPRRSEVAWRSALPLLWLAVPVALTALMSIVQPTFLARYLVVSVPALAVVAAGALARLRPLPLAAAALLALGVLQVGAVDDWYASRRPDYRGAAALLASRARWEEPVVTHPAANSTLAWYLGRHANFVGPGTVRRAEFIKSASEIADMRLLPRVWLVQTARGGAYEDVVPRRALGVRPVLHVWHFHQVRVTLLGAPLPTQRG